MKRTRTIGSLVVLAITFAAGTANAQQSCSELRDACIRGVTGRGYNPAPCYSAHQACLKRGIWKTSGTYGKRVDNVSRQ